jgi:broad specificity phosphatase PhoE
MASLFLIRHDEPELKGVLLGQLDSPLSAAGRKHALHALSDVHVPIVWTSPLLRAKQTAALLNTKQITELSNLREIDLGQWTGRTWHDIETSWPDLAQRKSSDWLGIAAPGGEDWPSFLTRVSTAVQTIRQGPSGAAVVAHQGVNAALTHLIAGRDPLIFTQEYGEVIHLEYD